MQLLAFGIIGGPVLSNIQTTLAKEEIQKNIVIKGEFKCKYCIETFANQ